MTPTVRCEPRGDVVELVLDRPDKLNAIDPSMASALAEHLTVLADSSARAVVLRAEGRAFSAGRDVNADWGDRTAQELLESIFNPLVAAVAGLPMPTLAAIQGHCLGLGLGLAMACDLRVTAGDAKLGSPFGKRGSLLDSGGHQLLLEAVGRSRTLELIYTSRTLDGREAVEWGLANECVPGERLTHHTARLAEGIASGPTVAFKESKRIVNRLGDRTRLLNRSLTDEARSQAKVFRTSDFREAIDARRDGREPVFHGR